MSTRTKIILATVLVALGVAGRLMPHAWNFTPIIAIGLFAGAYLGPRFAFIVPVTAMVVSDIFIGFYAWQMNATVYAAMALSGLLGLAIRNRKNPVSIGLAAMAGSTLFFFITNAAVWFFGSSYAPGIEGLTASLVAGLPFFRNALAGDIWYSWSLFGAYGLVTYGVRYLRLRAQTNKTHNRSLI
ncbi:MAG: hypothetical protein Q8L64_04310 [bacterium]|nr:hypothetical protein [bacterium]